MKLNQPEIEDRLEKLPEWALEDNALVREYEFKDFALAFGFMTSVAVVAEKLNHHPEWSNTYNRVAVRLTTHDQGGVSELDFVLAMKMEELAK